MQPIRVVVSGTSTTTPLVVDYMFAPFELSLAIDTVSGVVAATAQYTFDDVLAEGYNPATGNWFTDSVILGVSVATSTTISMGPVRAVRFVNVGTGSFVATVLQSGGGVEATTNSSYTLLFGGQNVNPTQLSYLSYTRATSLTLVWPIEAPPNADVAAGKLDIAMELANLTVMMPPADQVSPGQDVLIRNIGAETFSVLDSFGSEIGSVASGEAWFFVVTDNDTPAGIWYAIEFGVGTSAATAAALAGAGLRAASNKLDQNLITAPISGSRSIVSADRAKVLQNSGGVAAWSFASAVTLGNGWFVYIINAGTGTITLSTQVGQTIDGMDNKMILRDESLIAFSDGVNIHTLGYGRTLVSAITASIIDVAGTGTLILNGTELAAQIQNYVGTLTGDKIVEYGGNVGYWFVVNNTTGAHTLTLRVNSLDPGAVITQGNFSIVRNDGTNMDIAFTDTFGTVTSITAGTGLTATPNPIVTAGTIAITNTAVTAGSYGDVSSTLSTTVNAQGQLTALAQLAISIPISQIQVFTSAQLAARVSDETGTGALVFATAPALGTPTSLTLTNATGLPISTGVAGLGTGVATFLATPSSANFAAAVTGETGTGAVVFGTAPTLSNPIVGTQTAHDNSTKAASTAYADRIGIQQIQTLYDGTNVTTAGTGIPVDNTIPQQTEGDQILSLAITPLSATSRLTIEVQAIVARGNSDNAVLSLFQDATAGALKSTVGFIVTGDAPLIMTLKYDMVSGTTSATTFKIRIGSNTPAVLYFNGLTTGGFMGGTSDSFIRITEYGV